VAPTAKLYTGLPSSLPEIARWQTVLSDVELKIQGFDLGKLFGQLRTSISPPDEINGFVEKTGSTVRAGVNCPNRKLKNDALMNTPFETGELSGEASVALAIAANIVWAQAAEAEAAFARIPREVFVAWALTWWDYRQIRARKALGEQASEEDKKRWAQARRLVEGLIGQAENYPEIWRLRADIIDAASDSMASEQEKVIAREDRVRYARAVAAATGALAPPELSVTAQPGLAIWARSATKRVDEPFSVSMTATAIVVDSSGKRKVLLPDYAIFERAGDGETEFAMSPAGPVVARASKKDIIYNETPGTPEKGGVVLAMLEQNTKANNTLAGAGPLKKVAPIPSPGATIKLFSPGHIEKRGQIVRSGIIQKVEEPFVVTDGRVTEPGDGGAPVLDANGDLIAMGYMGTEKESRLLSVNWVFERASLKLLSSD